MDVKNLNKKLMAHIRKIVDKIYARLPKKYRIPVKIHKSRIDMLRQAYRDTRGKEPTEEEFEEYDEMYKRWVTDSKYEENSNKFRIKSKSKKKHRKYSLIGLGGNPILLNRYKLDEENDDYIAHTILHEIKHNICKQNGMVYDFTEEKLANVFACRWVKILKKDGIV